MKETSFTAVTVFLPVDEKLESGNITGLLYARGLALPEVVWKEEWSICWLRTVSIYFMTRENDFASSRVFIFEISDGLRIFCSYENKTSITLFYMNYIQ